MIALPSCAWVHNGKRVTRPSRARVVSCACSCVACTTIRSLHCVCAKCRRDVHFGWRTCAMCILSVGGRPPRVPRRRMYEVCTTLESTCEGSRRSYDFDVTYDYVACCTNRSSIEIDRNSDIHSSNEPDVINQRAQSPAIRYTLRSTHDHEGEVSRFSRHRRHPRHATSTSYGYIQHTKTHTHQFITLSQTHMAGSSAGCPAPTRCRSPAPA